MNENIQKNRIKHFKFLQKANTSDDIRLDYPNDYFVYKSDYFNATPASSYNPRQNTVSAKKCVISDDYLLDKSSNSNSNDDASKSLDVCIDFNDSLVKSFEYLTCRASNSLNAFSDSKKLCEELRQSWDSIYYNRIDPNFKFYDKNVKILKDRVKEEKMPKVNNTKPTSTRRIRNTNFNYNYNILKNSNVKSQKSIEKFSNLNNKLTSRHRRAYNAPSIQTILPLKMSKKEEKQVMTSTKLIEFPSIKVTIRAETPESEIGQDNELKITAFRNRGVKLSKAEFCKLKLKATFEKDVRQLYFHPKSLSFTPYDINPVMNNEEN